MVDQGRGGRIVGASSLAGKQGEDAIFNVPGWFYKDERLFVYRLAAFVYVFIQQVHDPWIDPGGR